MQMNRSCPVKNTHGKIFATCNSTGFWQAAIPVLNRLMAAGHIVHTAAAKSSPSVPFIVSKGFSCHVLKNTSIWNDPAAVNRVQDLLCDLEPDCILVGVADTSAGSEKTAIFAAHDLGIPIVVLVESWPHMWLAAYGERDTPLYQQRVEKVCVMDSLAQAKLLEVGYKQDQVVVTGNPFNDVLAGELAHKDAYRGEVRAHFGIAPEAFVFSYMTTDDLDNPVGPDHPEWLGHTEESVLREFLIALHLTKCEHGDKMFEGIVRVKPGFKGMRVRELIAEICPTAHYDSVNHQGKPHALFAPNIIVTRYSQMLDHAAQLGLPTISVLPNLYAAHRRPIVNQLELVTARYRVGDLLELIKITAANPEAALWKMRDQRRSLSPMVANATDNVTNLLERYMVI